MKAPLVVITGGIATGKSLVASEFAARGGCLIDADELAHGALADPDFLKRLRSDFGDGVFTASGRASRKKIAGVVFLDQKELSRFESLIRPFVKKLIRAEISEKRKREKYIVLDAVLFFQYKFRFKADLVVRTTAPPEVCLKRMMARDGFTLREAGLRLERQRPLHADWARAEITIDTDRNERAVRKEASRLRDEFLRKQGLLTGRP